jgi:hypothetical protein
LQVLLVAPFASGRRARDDGPLKKSHYQNKYRYSTGKPYVKIRASSSAGCHPYSTLESGLPGSLSDAKLADDPPLGGMPSQAGETGMSDRPRAIVHLDLDAFYAAVEMLERPELAGKALLIGGSPEGRGVVSTASYAARAFGVRSAMPTYRALQLCPQAIVLPPRHRLYRDYSHRVMAILREATALLEQVSIDEAYLDLTEQVKVWDEAIPLARQLQCDVRRETGLSASLGVASNKLVAKVASDQN